MSLRVVSKFNNQPYVYWYVNNNPTLLASFMPPSYDTNGMADDPVFLAPNKTFAARWYYTSSGLVLKVLPPEYGRVEYVPMTAPNGTLYVYGMNNDQSFYLQAFDSGSPTNRLVQMTIVHKGDLVWVADNRQPMPRPEDQP